MNHTFCGDSPVGSWVVDGEEVVITLYCGFDSEGYEGSNEYIFTGSLVDGSLEGTYTWTWGEEMGYYDGSYGSNCWSGSLLSDPVSVTLTDSEASTPHSPNCITAII